MIEIKNISDEPIEIISAIDTKVPGCRMIHCKFPPRRLEPGQVELQLMYEPGMTFRAQPVNDPATPRQLKP